MLLIYYFVSVQFFTARSSRLKTNTMLCLCVFIIIMVFVLTPTFFMVNDPRKVNFVEKDRKSVV